MEFLSDYVDIIYHSGKANVVAIALSRRLINCGVRLAAMDIQLEDHLIDAGERQIASLMVRLTISLTILESINWHKDGELPEQLLSRRSHAVAQRCKWVGSYEGQIVCFGDYVSFRFEAADSS